MELFESHAPPAPLADRLRPATLDTFVGQEGLVGPGRPLRRILESGKTPPSMVFWGPPGCGKTTLARIISGGCGLHFTQFSAVTSGVKDVRKLVEEAKARRRSAGEGTILFVDEIHRFNRAQQDAFLPHIEAGVFVLVGATTENPSFELNSALLSRCRVFVLEPLPDEGLSVIVRRAAEALQAKFEDDALEAIAETANGDARIAINLVELTGGGTTPVTVDQIREAAQRRVLYDKDRDEHYNAASALIKSMRASDPDAALYWLARMLEGGEDPLFIVRRMVIFASEDVGNADPRALQVAVAAQQAVDFVGMPEGYLPLAQAATYLATAPKSNASLTAYKAAKKDVEETRNEPVPLHLRNAPTALMRDEGYGKDYIYAHDDPDAALAMGCRPPGVAERVYYRPRESGYEATIGKMMNVRHTRARKRKQEAP